MKMTETSRVFAKILVVDDIQWNLEVLVDLLEPKGYRVNTATSGEEALDLIETETPDLVLLDVMMPRMDGHEVCSRIRGNKHLPYIPIIFITASEFDRESIVKGLDAGGDDYLRKPIDPLELFSRIRACLRVKSLYDELKRTQTELSRYVSLSTRKMVEGLTSGDTQPVNRSAEVTILFTDIRRFTEISENLDPEGVFEKLSQNLANQIGIIEKNNGVIDKLSGDEVMAVFEGPEMVPNAFRCALEIIGSIASNMKEDRDDWFQVGIGINTGKVFLGSLGSESFRDYTVIGNNVNLAARLCGLAKKLQILFTNSTWEYIQDRQFNYRTIGRYPIKGLKNQIEIFELLK